MSTTETEVIEARDVNEAVLDPSFKINSWDGLEIDSLLLRGIYSYGFENPSVIQQQAIKPLIMGKDIVIQAQSVTGKTATFTIGALANVDVTDNNTQVLVLSPTKELTIQTAKVFTGLGSMMEGLRVQALYGGSVVEEGSTFSNKKTPHVICGCPGRVFDMMRRSRISSKKIKLVILDEADEMLSAGFKEQVYNIFQYFSSNIQVALVSATLPDSINAIVEKIMRNPIRISVKRELLTLEGIAQYYIAVDDDRQKYATLKDLYGLISISSSIIYCNSVKRVQDLYEAMKEDDFSVCRIHSGMDKEERAKAFEDFRVGRTRVLISSNVTARGIDIQQVSVVVNFDIPKCVNVYLHRIGRSGRWGRKGIGLNMITRRDVAKLKEIEQHYSTQISEMPGNVDFLIGK
jgi:superfamily II DNA/RNA helicase